jgi:hypothetical protein
MTARPLAQLTTVVTCFAFREEYFPELSGMIATIKEVPSRVANRDRPGERPRTTER